MGFTLLNKGAGLRYCTSPISPSLLPGDMRIFSLIVAGLVLLIQLHPGKKEVAGEAVLAT